MHTQTLSFSQLVKAKPSEVYRSFINATALREWLCDTATVIPHAGGRLYLWWNSGYYASGEFLETESGQKLVFTWLGRGEPGSSQVQVTFSEKDGETQVTLEHSGLGIGEDWSRTLGAVESGWKKGLENLASVLATGEDLRFTLRPMLGILIGEFNAEIAEELGVPVTNAVRLDGVVENMGSQAAGLQSNDVIVRMAGIPTVDWDSLTFALQKHRAGDTVEVVYYRGAEKNTVMMELSRRPIPDIPFSTTELVTRVRKIYAEMHAEMDKFLAGVTEDEASFKPAPDEWSIKGNLAHIIQGERGYQSWITELIGGYERVADDYGGNIHAYIDATLAVYPTLPELVNAYKRASTETVELLARLPDEFLERKSSYWRVAYASLEEPYHFRSHIDQMRAALEAARSAVMAT